MVATNCPDLSQKITFENKKRHKQSCRKVFSHSPLPAPRNPFARATTNKSNSIPLSEAIMHPPRHENAVSNDLEQRERVDEGKPLATTTSTTFLARLAVSNAPSKQKSHCREPQNRAGGERVNIYTECAAKPEQGSEVKRRAGIRRHGGSSLAFQCVARGGFEYCEAERARGGLKLFGCPAYYAM